MFFKHFYNLAFPNFFAQSSMEQSPVLWTSQRDNRPGSGISVRSHCRHPQMWPQRWAARGPCSATSDISKWKPILEVPWVFYSNRNRKWWKNIQFYRNIYRIFQDVLRLNIVPVSFFCTRNSRKMIGRRSSKRCRQKVALVLAFSADAPGFEIWDSSLTFQGLKA